MHTGVQLGKNITAAVYGRVHDKSYYLGCSTGGRQGFKEVQDFPEDFDGLIIGAPALNFNNLNTWSAHFLTITGTPDDPNFISQELWEDLVHEDIMAQCDELDGLRDGILEAPDLCDYNPDGLLCGIDANSTLCLNAAQVEIVRQVLAPMNALNGTMLYPRLQPGADGIFRVYLNGVPSDKVDWERYVVFADEAWDPTTFTQDQWTLADELNPFDIATTKGDISTFRDLGGKVLHYHGLADPVISSSMSPIYYEHVASTMGLGTAEMDEFYRYFRVSGMAHCERGTGAHAIGNRISNFVSFDPDENVLMAMVRWVEEGVAPETITGARFVEGRTTEVDYKRRHCKWPSRNVFVGEDPTDPNDWECTVDAPAAMNPSLGIGNGTLTGGDNGTVATNGTDNSDGTGDNDAVFTGGSVKAGVNMFATVLLLSLAAAGGF